MAVVEVMLRTVASTACRLVVVPATELVMPPAVVRVRPLVERSPPWPASTVPFEKVLVAVFDWKMFPPVIFNPLLEERPVVIIPPENVEDAVEVAMILYIVEVP